MITCSVNYYIEIGEFDILNFLSSKNSAIDNLKPRALDSIIKYASSTSTTERLFS